MKYKNIYINTEKRLEDCLLSLWTKGQHPMRQSIELLFQREPFIGEPLFQSAFGWEHVSPATNWKTLFDPRVAQMIEAHGTNNGQRQWAPYKHQYECWEILNGSGPGNAQSIVVTSGTGSGKTECFLYPVLDDMYRHRGEGVQAIFMYPLNALAADQKGRIEKCCMDLGLTFACYNGNMPENGRGLPGSPEKVSREEVRSSRPDLLMTNPSMLEYIMVRDADRPVMEPNSPNTQQSTLRWIVIDEAHTYTGSAAVELRYELSRLIKAFGADRKDLHFACTSATIGSDPAQLVSFIEELTGQDAARIHVKGGRRVVSDWTQAEIQAELTRKGLLFSPASVMRLRAELNSPQKDYLTCAEIYKILFQSDLYDRSKTVDVLDAVDQLCDIYRNTAVGTKDFLLMARAHFFMREPNGLFACANPACPEHGQSPMGYITSFDGKSCPHCGAPLLELVQCRTCGEFMYTAKEDTVTHEISIHRDRTFDNVDNIYAEDDNSAQPQNPNIQGSQRVIKAGMFDPARLIPSLVKMSYDFTFVGSTMSKVNSQTGRYISYVNRNQTDCCCGCGQVASLNNISSFRVSMNTLKQVVTPALLAESTPNAGQPLGKYISFTDSRQKTAISAKLFNISQEREYAMGQILHFLSVDRLQIGSIREIPLWAFSPIVVSSDIFEHLCRDKTNVLELESYRAAVMRTAVGKRLIRGAGSLETMGLVSLVYPTLRTVYMPPRLLQWKIANNSSITDDDWRDFLKICLDYCVRMGNCIQPVEAPLCSLPYEKDYIRDNKPTVISDGNLPYGKKWPQINSDTNGISDTQEKIVLLLCAALGITSTAQLSIPSNYNLIKDLLVDAWNQLINPAMNLFKFDANKNGYFLDLSASNQYVGSIAMLKLNEKAFICPVTHSLLDVTFMGYSPMIKGRLDAANINRYKCTGPSIDMPLLDSVNKAVIPAWLSSNKEVSNLKALGLWSNYYESVFLNADVYVAAEHSAQLGRSRLEEYTGQFKGDPNFPGRLNILNCSTTMEMGVDIGDIDLVVLSNVPPAASNYLQRAGRAGRFGQSQSAAFTTCSSSVLGMDAFFNPSVMLKDQSVRLMPKGSSTIIQRHINSFFFRTFVTSGGMSVNGATTAEDFFIDNVVVQGQSVCDAFVAHLNTLPRQIANDFAELFPNSYPYQASLLATINKIQSVQAAFVGIYHDLVNEITAAGNNPPRQRAAQAQLLRYADQDLLSYLSEMQFFPNASMPTGIVEFDASTRNSQNYKDTLRVEIKNLRAQRRTASPAQKVNIDNQIARKRSLLNKANEETIVSRESNVALNEYAPQQTVVVDEKNYISFALVEMSQYGYKSKQKFIQRCDHCGWTTFTDLCPQNVQVTCPNCNQGMLGPLLSAADDPLAMSLPFTYAQEAVGYRADYNSDEDHKETNAKRFYKINALLPGFTWNNASQVGLCDIAGTDDGRIVYTNKGDGYGFAICKNRNNGHYCGRAVVDVPLSSIPSGLSSGHCRTTWRKQNGIQMASNITRHVVLSCEQQTSYAAMAFWCDYNRNSVYSSESFLYSMGIVLKKAICLYLAIDENEIAFDVNRVGGSNFLFLYDTNKGGAGYSSNLQFPQVSRAVFDVALDIVEGFVCDCKDHPGSACTKCLVDRNSYSYSDILSLYDVYEWLKNQKKQFRSVPAAINTLSPGCRYDLRMPIEILKQAVSRSDVNAITFFIPKECTRMADDWNDAASDIHMSILNAKQKGKQVKLILEKPSQSEPLEEFSLFNTANKMGWLDSVQGASFSGPIRSVLLLEGSGVVEHYFTTDFDKIPLSNQWGVGCNDVFCDNRAPAFNLIGLPTAADMTALMAAGKTTLRDGFIPDGAYSTDAIFQRIIVPYVIKNDASVIGTLRSVLDGKRVKVAFCDNYLVNALACHMLAGLIVEIQNFYHLSIDAVDLFLDASLCDNSRQNDYTKIGYSYKCNSDRDEFITDLIEKGIGITPSILINNTHHHRWLKIVTIDGDVFEIRPDHGLSGGWYSALQYGDLPYLGNSPVTFKKNKKNGKPEESILYYLRLTKA